MEIKGMNIEELEQRSLEIAENAKEADKETLESLGAELEEIETRKAELKKEAEERAKAMEEVINAPAPSPVVEERNTKMTNIEVRKTNEYIEAYERFVKGGYKDDTECRALLTENVSGNVPVPAYLEDRINTAWENDGIMSRVNRINLPGNVKVGYEASASGAVWHTEGTTAVSEESLSLGIITLVPKMIKKWISVSDEALALTGTAFLDYLYDELEYRIIKKAADEVIAKIMASSLTENAGSAAPIDAVLTAFSELSDEATDIVAIMSKTTYATIKSAAKAANYAVDSLQRRRDRRHRRRPQGRYRKLPRRWRSQVHLRRLHTYDPGSRKNPRQTVRSHRCNRSGKTCKGNSQQPHNSHNLKKR